MAASDRNPDSIRSRNLLARAAFAALGAVPAAAFATAPNFHRAVDLVWFSQTVDQRALDMTMDNLGAMGVDHVGLNVWWFQNNISSTTIAPNFSLYSSSDATINQVIDAAHARGMAVELRPLVDLSNDPSHWRGEITGGTTWFNGAGGYGDYMRHMADIAQAKNVELLSVGVELESTASQESNWRGLISSVRSHYSGPITYGANWGNPAIGSTINWWDAVDYMGIDAYYPLTGVTNPTSAQLQSAWATRANQIESYRNSVAPTKQILYTEAGYQNFDGTNTIPYGTISGAANDQQEQADCYQALLSQNTPKSWFQGVYWWAFDLNPNLNAIDYNPMGKLAYDVMGSYYVPGYTLGPSWTGGGGASWSTGASWSGGTAPGNLTTANFNGSGGGNTNISLGGGVTIARLIFSGTPAAYSFQSGNTLTFNPGGGITITNTVANNQTLNCSVALQGPAIFANQGSGQLILNGAISGANSGLERIAIMYSGGGQLNGVISDGAGTVALFKAGSGTWTVSNNNTYSGETAILGGNLLISHSHALGSSAGGTYVARGASLQMNAALNVVGEPLQISGDGNGGQGAFQLLTNGPATWTGDITLSGSAQIANRAFSGGGTATLVLGGKISGGDPNSTLSFRGSNSFPGFFRLTGSASDYLGTTYVWGTKLILAGADNILPTTTVVDLDSLGRAASLDAGVLDLNGTNQTIAGLTNHAAATPARVVNRAAGTLRTLTINNSIDFTYAGGILNDAGQVALFKSGSGNQTLAGSSNFTGGTTVSAGSLTLAHFSAVGSGSLTVSGGVAQFTAGLALAPVLAAVNTSGSGQLDLMDNDLVIHYSGSSPLNSIAAQITSGYAGGAWTGNGIRSSTAAAVFANSSLPHKTAIGFGSASALSITSFSGQNVDATSILLRYTLYGDGNLDGSVDTTDFNLLAANFGSASATWIQGDWNYDQTVDTLDFNLLAANFSATQSAFIGALIPEPGMTSLAMMSLGVSVLQKRSRPRKRPAHRVQ